MLLNSIHERCPNNDPKQCTVTKLGWVHSAHTQSPGRAHTARAVPMSWVLLRAQQTCCEHVGCSACAGRAHSAQVVGACRDLFPLSIPRQVVTSFPSRDLLEANPCHDIKLVSRHRSGHSKSRPPNGVATPFLCPAPKPGRDIKTRSRPSWRLTYVATSLLPQ